MYSVYLLIPYLKMQYEYDWATKIFICGNCAVSAIAKNSRRMTNQFTYLMKEFFRGSVSAESRCNTVLRGKGKCHQCSDSVSSTSAECNLKLTSLFSASIIKSQRSPSTAPPMCLLPFIGTLIMQNVYCKFCSLVANCELHMQKCKKNTSVVEVYCKSGEYALILAGH